MRSHGLVADAGPARLVQIMFEHILSNLRQRRAAWSASRTTMPLKRSGCQVQGHGQGRPPDRSAGQHVGHGAGPGRSLQNLRNLYLYMLARLTLANAKNDAQIVAEVVALVRKIKSGWDQIVADGR